MSLSTLLIDDDRGFSGIAAAALQREGFPVVVAHSLAEARKAVSSGGFEFIVLDRRLPDGDGLTFLPELKKAQPKAIVVMVTAHGDIASAVDAIRAGAVDYLAKPIELSDLVMKARRSADDIRLRERLEHAETALSGRRAMIRPQSAVMLEVVDTLERIARTSPKSPVMLLGETGVGKEVLAWHGHVTALGEAAPFIHVNCAALPETTAESELFGHERGAFTDAKATRRGLVELANAGTLFLDEVGELSASLQAKLLTFLDSGRFRRLGGAQELTSTARVVTATNRDLEAEVTKGTFREDLWFRLSVFRLRVPALRERRDDLPSLVTGLLQRVRADQGRREVLTLSASGLSRLERYAFPGNVRELRNILERASVLERSPVLDLQWLEARAAGAPADGFALPKDIMPLEEVDRRYAQWALDELGGKRMEAAKVIHVSYPTFLKLIRGEE